MVNPDKYTYRLLLLTENKQLYNITDYVTDLGWEELEKELAVRISFTGKNDQTSQGRLSELIKPGCYLAILYLDGIYFANLTPGTATTKLPIWPEADGNNYAYGERVWKFPGNGTEYPLAPGESCIISQFAANHQLDIYNPQSPIDGSSSEFEFNMNNPNFPDQAAYDMQHVFYRGKAEMGSIPQYLTSVFGGAYVIFRVPEGEAWDPVNDENMKTTDLSKPNSNVYYAKIPIKYVLDAVEAVDNESKMNAKRVPGVLDAGITWVGATYCGLGIARKLSTDEEGNPIIREETGTYIYQDTNNSTDDFERGVVPVMRRNGAKMPSWNHTL